MKNRIVLILIAVAGLTAVICFAANKNDPNAPVTKKQIQNPKDDLAAKVEELERRVALFEKRLRRLYKVKKLEHRVELLEKKVSRLYRAAEIKKSDIGASKGGISHRERFLRKNPTPLELEQYNKLHGPRRWKDGTWADDDTIYYPDK